MTSLILMIYIIFGGPEKDKVPQSIINEINGQIQWQNGSRFASLDAPKYFQKSKSKKSTESTYKNGVLISHQNFDEMGRMSNSINYNNGLVTNYEINYYDKFDKLVKSINNSGVEEYSYVADSIINLMYYPINENQTFFEKANYKINESVLESTVYITTDTVTNYYYFNDNKQIEEHVIIVNSDTLRNSIYQYDKTNKLIFDKFDDNFSAKYKSLAGIFQDSETTLYYDNAGLIISKEKTELEGNNVKSKITYLYQTTINNQNGEYSAKIKFTKDGKLYKELDLKFNNRKDVVKKKYNLISENKKTTIEYKINYR